MIKTHFRKIWNALTGDVLHSFEHKHIVRACAFSDVSFSLVSKRLMWDSIILLVGFVVLESLVSSVFVLMHMLFTF